MLKRKHPVQPLRRNSFFCMLTRSACAVQPGGWLAARVGRSESPRNVLEGERYHYATTNIHLMTVLKIMSVANKNKSVLSYGCPPQLPAARR
jgi:hypothetical protein